VFDSGPAAEFRENFRVQDFFQIVQTAGDSLSLMAWSLADMTRLSPNGSGPIVVLEQV
jgi:hypothetical protein